LVGGYLGNESAVPTFSSTLNMRFYRGYSSWGHDADHSHKMKRLRMSTATPPLHQMPLWVDRYNYMFLPEGKHSSQTLVPTY
jgi:hypothetical protein